MKPSDLTYAGPELERLRRDLAHFVGKYNAYQSNNNASLKQMLQDAIDGIVVPVEAPAYLGGGSPIGMNSIATNPTDNLTDYTSMKPEDFASLGTWTGDDIVYTYQWYRFDGVDTKTDIPGATNDTYNITSDDLGFAIGVKVTGTNDGGSDTADLGWNCFSPEGTFDKEVVVDADLVPNEPASGTATAGAAGELDISLVAGTQIVDHPDTSYRITLTGSSSQHFTIESITETITGVPAGTYNVLVTRVYNDVTGRSCNVSIGSDVVVS